MSLSFDCLDKRLSNQTWQVYCWGPNGDRRSVHISLAHLHLHRFLPIFNLSQSVFSLLLLQSLSNRHRNWQRPSLYQAGQRFAVAGPQPLLKYCGQGFFITITSVCQRHIWPKGGAVSASSTYKRKESLSFCLSHKVSREQLIRSSSHWAGVLLRAWGPEGGAVWSRSEERFSGTPQWARPGAEPSSRLTLPRAPQALSWCY